MLQRNSKSQTATESVMLKHNLLDTHPSGELRSCRSAAVSQSSQSLESSAELFVTMHRSCFFLLTSCNLRIEGTRVAAAQRSEQPSQSDRTPWRRRPRHQTHRHLARRPTRLRRLPMSRQDFRLRRRAAPADPDRLATRHPAAYPGSAAPRLETAIDEQPAEEGKKGRGASRTVTRRQDSSRERAGTPVAAGPIAQSRAVAQSAARHASEPAVVAGPEPRHSELNVHPGRLLAPDRRGRPRPRPPD